MIGMVYPPQRAPPAPVSVTAGKSAQEGWLVGMAGWPDDYYTSIIQVFSNHPAIQPSHELFNYCFTNFACPASTPRRS
jgi:hypothetical protein